MLAVATVLYALPQAGPREVVTLADQNWSVAAGFVGLIVMLIAMPRALPSFCRPKREKPGPAPLAPPRQRTPR